MLEGINIWNEVKSTSRQKSLEQRIENRESKEDVCDCEKRSS